MTATEVELKSILRVLEERLANFERTNLEGHRILIEKLVEIQAQMKDLSNDNSDINEWIRRHEVQTATNVGVWEAKYGSIRMIIWIHTASIVFLFLVTAPKLGELITKIL